MHYSKRTIKNQAKLKIGKTSIAVKTTNTVNIVIDLLFGFT